MSKEKRFTVIGAGHGGKAMAADLAARGFKVTLYNRTPARISEITLRADIELEREDGTICTGHLEHATSNITEALDGADVIMVVVPAPGHQFIAQICAPHLEDGQVIILNPGRTGGAMEFSRIVRRAGCTKDILIAEACSFIFVSRSTGPAQARIFRHKNSVPLAALPATKTREVLNAVRDAYPQFIPAANVLYTSLDNIGAVLHPALALLNAGWIERTKGEFQFYIDGATRSVAHVLEMLDYERMAVAGALLVGARSATRWLDEAYSAKGITLYEAIQANPGYQGINAPRNLRHRYISEDVPFSLVPLASLGKQFSVETPTINAMIRLAGAVHIVDYFECGRTIEDMGLKGMSVREIKHFVETGKTPKKKKAVRIKTE